MPRDVNHLHLESKFDDRLIDRLLLGYVTPVIVALCTGDRRKKSLSFHWSLEQFNLYMHVFTGRSAFVPVRDGVDEEVPRFL